MISLVREPIASGNMTDGNTQSPAAQRTLKRHILWGGGIVLALMTGIILWLFAAQLSGAVVAFGQDAGESIEFIAV